jgi:hypothetical protein
MENGPLFIWKSKKTFEQYYIQNNVLIEGSSLFILVHPSANLCTYEDIEAKQMLAWTVLGLHMDYST